MNLLLLGSIAAVATATVSAALTAALIRSSARLRLVATPRADRWHRNITPNTGGIAILLSCILAYLVVGGSGHYGHIAVAGAVMSLIGILDDRIQLRPVLKLAAQTLVTIALLAGGVVFRPFSWEPLNLAVTFLWIVGITNALNLIDNMDGLCAGVTIIICVFRFAVAAGSDDREGVLFTAILAGAFLGFLVFNYKPARIFMGDGGSMFAGFTLAALAIVSPVPHKRAVVSGLLYPALTFLYPIFDTILVSVLRRLAGRPISVGGRDHSSHRLVSLGLTEAKAVWLLWGLTAVGSVAGALSGSMPTGIIVIGALLLLGVTVLGIFLGTLPAYAMPESAPVRGTRIRARIPTLRAGIIVSVDTLLAGVALLCAFLLRWENAFVGVPMRQFILSLPVMMACHAIACVAFCSFHCGWRWFDSRDLMSLTKCVAASTTGSIVLLWISGLRDYSRGVVLLYAFLLVSLAAALRALMRLFWHALAKPAQRPRVAVLGANAAGELAILMLQKQERLGGLPVIVLDTDPAADGTKIHGVPVRYAGTNPLRLLQGVDAGILIVPPNRALTQPEHELIAGCASGGVQIARLEMAITPVTSQAAAAIPSGPSQFQPEVLS